jgi:hypothetical protein
MTPMSKNPLLYATASLALLSSAASSRVAPRGVSPVMAPIAETVLKESDHKKVGGLMGECIQAFVEKEGRRDAEEELSSTIRKKWSKAAKGRDPLALSDDLAASLWYSMNYTKVKGIKKGKIVDLPVEVGFFGEGYVSTAAVWTPKKYSAKKKYPLVICIPDEGEKPQGHLNDHWANSGMRDSAILVALDMPEDSSLWGETGERDVASKAGGLPILLLTYRLVRERYAIDFDRVFLAGRGPGVAAAMQIANRSSSRFCGIVGRTGDAADLPPENLSNVPCFFAGGGKRASEFAERTTGEGQAERVFMADAKLDDVWAWMQTVTRRSNPEEAFLLPGSPVPNTSYWLQVPPKEYADGARIAAKADRASNTITIEATGIESCTLYLNDTLVDLEKPVKVILNGSVNEDLIPRNFHTMMGLIYSTRCEPGRVYTAKRDYDIPLVEPKDAE